MENDTHNIPPSQTEIIMDSDETTRYPSPYVPVLKLAGSPYEIGFQHGQQAKTYINSNIRAYSTWFQQTAGLSWTEAKQRATTFVPTLQRLYPEILDEIQGIADGAGLERDDILAINVRSEIGLTIYDDSPENEPPAITDGCTALAQTSSDGSKTILAQNWDWIEGLENGMIVVDITTDEGTRMQFLNEAGLVGKIGLNSHGFGLCNNAIKCGAMSNERFPTHVMSRRLLQYARSVDEAVDMLEMYSGACATNYVLADAKGTICDVEVSPRGISSIVPLPKASETDNSQAGHGPMFVAHTNHIVSPPGSFPKGPIYDRPTENSFSRLARISELTMDDMRNNVPFTTEAVVQRLKDRQGAPDGICRDVPTDATGPERIKTLASIVMEFDNVRGTAGGFVAIGKPCNEGLQRVDWAF